METVHINPGSGSPGSGGVTGESLGTISYVNTPEPVVTVKLSGVSDVNESNSLNISALYRIELDLPATSAITVFYEIKGITATSDLDYQNVSSYFTFVPGNTAFNFSVPVLPDKLTEPTESFSVSITKIERATSNKIESPSITTLIHDSTNPVYNLPPSNPNTSQDESESIPEMPSRGPQMPEFDRDDDNPVVPPLDPTPNDKEKGQGEIDQFLRDEFRIKSVKPVDKEYYNKINTDVSASGIDPERHYNNDGWHEGRDPNAFFSTKGYLTANLDVAKAALNPLTHYETYGWKEGRDPGVHFDNEFYLARNADVKAAGLNPLTHYLEYGQVEGRAIHDAVGRAGDIKGGFDAEFYLLSNTDVAQAAQGTADSFAFARQHFDTYGWKEGRDPNAVFDTKGYLAAYGDVAAAGVNPLAHYDTYGWKEGRDPSKDFDTTAYLAANGDVAAAGIDPLQHYLQYGLIENRSVLNDGTFGFGLTG